MSLPKIAKITHELVIPSTGKKIKYRPFLVKEEKILILAQESGDQKEMARAIKDVIQACVQTRGFKVDELATFDIEFLFLNIRGNSVGGDVEVVITCPDDGVTRVPVTIYLDQIQVLIDDEHSKNVKLDDTYSVKMKYPTMEMVMETDSENVSVEQSLALIAGCIEQMTGFTPNAYFLVTWGGIAPIGMLVIFFFYILEVILYIHCKLKSLIPI